MSPLDRRIAMLGIGISKSIFDSAFDSLIWENTIGWPCMEAWIGFKPVCLLVLSQMPSIHSHHMVLNVAQINDGGTCTWDSWQQEDLDKGRRVPFFQCMGAFRQR